jgi:hypothetical protein
MKNLLELKKEELMAIEGGSLFGKIFTAAWVVLMAWILSEE